MNPWWFPSNRTKKFWEERAQHKANIVNASLDRWFLSKSKGTVLCSVRPVFDGIDWSSASALNWTHTDKEKISLDDSCFCVDLSNRQQWLFKSTLCSSFTRSSLTVRRTRLTDSWTQSYWDNIPENVSTAVYHNNMVSIVGVRASGKRRAGFDLQNVVDAYFSASV